MKLNKIDGKLWGKYNVAFTAHPDVNVIVGVNGSGKTTLLTILVNKVKDEKSSKIDYIYIPSIDNIAVRDKRRTNANALTQNLEYYIYDMKNGPSLMNYRMSMIDADSDIQKKTKDRIQDFCNIVNDLFKETGKSIEIVGNKFIVHSGNSNVEVKDLSSGEKQMLLTLLRVFLLDEQESIVFIDEPETSLDISWQYRLIDILVKLNPNAQYFITTHSPSIFGDGWGDRIIYMEDVTKPIDSAHE